MPNPVDFQHHTRRRPVISLGTNLLFSELDVDEEKDDAHEEADGADGDVGDAEEGVPPAEQRRRGDDHTLGAAELLHPKSLRKFNRCQYANACELYLNATYCSRC